MQKEVTPANEQDRQQVENLCAEVQIITDCFTCTWIKELRKFSLTTKQ